VFETRLRQSAASRLPFLYVTIKKTTCAFVSRNQKKNARESLIWTHFWIWRERQVGNEKRRQGLKEIPSVQVKCPASSCFDWPTFTLPSPSLTALKSSRHLRRWKQANIHNTESYFFFFLFLSIDFGGRTRDVRRQRSKIETRGQRRRLLIHSHDTGTRHKQGERERQQDTRRQGGSKINVLLFWRNVPFTIDLSPDYILLYFCCCCIAVVLLLHLIMRSRREVEVEPFHFFRLFFF
jgi:hypothetical protein